MSNFLEEKYKILTLLKSKGYTQASFAKQIGLSPQSFSAKINKGNIDLDFRELVASGLGFTLKKYSEYMSGGQSEENKLLEAKEEIIETKNKYIDALEDKIQLLEEMVKEYKKKV